MVRTPAVRAPVYKKNNFQEEQLKTTSLPPTEVENRASAPAREEAIPGLIDDLVDEPDAECDVFHKIQSLEGQSETSVTNEADSSLKARRSAANKLGDAWCAYLAAHGTEFPKSEPGTKFPKIAQFNKMTAELLMSYSVDEIFRALTELYDRADETFPPARMLEKQLVRGRKPRSGVLSPGSGRNDHGGGEPSTELAVRLSPDVADLVERIFHRWTAPTDQGGMGNFVPAVRHGELRALVADALSQGVQPSDVGNALVACLQTYGETCPKDWQFTKALAAIRTGQVTQTGHLTVVGGGSGHSTTAARVAQADALVRHYQQQEEAEERARKVQAEGGVA